MTFRDLWRGTWYPPAERPVREAVNGGPCRTRVEKRSRWNCGQHLPSVTSHPKAENKRRKLTLPTSLLLLAFDPSRLVGGYYYLSGHTALTDSLRLSGRIGMKELRGVKMDRRWEVRVGGPWRWLAGCDSSCSSTNEGEAAHSLSPSAILRDTCAPQYSISGVSPSCLSVFRVLSRGRVDAPFLMHFFSCPLAARAPDPCDPRERVSSQKITTTDVSRITKVVSQLQSWMFILLLE